MTSTLLADLDDLAGRLKRLADAPIAGDVVEEAARAWEDIAKQRVGVDTGQLKARTRIVSVRQSGASATGEVESDTPYAGFHEYGTRYTPPRRYFRDGRDAAYLLVRRAGPVIGTEIRRVLTSGGVWNPRAGWLA